MKKMRSVAVGFLLSVVLTAASSFGGVADSYWYSTLSVGVIGEGGSASVTQGEATMYSKTDSLSTSVTHARTVTATPKPGYSFVGWYANPDGTGSALSTDLVLSYAITVTPDNSQRTGSLLGGYTYTRNESVYARFALAKEGGVANIGAVYYQTLAEALAAAVKGDTITVYKNVERGDFTIGKNVKVELGGFGAEGSTYALDVDVDHPGAAIVTTRLEPGVTVPAGYGVDIKCYRGVCTFTAYRAHLHQWNLVATDTTLTATCAAEDCDVHNGPFVLEFVVTGSTDGRPPAVELAGKEVFRQVFGTNGVSFGSVSYRRITDDGATCERWYVGSYVATCTVTVDGKQYAFSRSFSITKAGETYASGYVVASRDIRYDSLAEAVAAYGGADDVIRLPAAGGDQLSYDFSSDRDVTIDLCGATLKQTKQLDQLYIRNNGSGTVLLVNGTIQQPKNGINRGRSVHFTGSGNGGKIVLGHGMRVVNVANSAENYAKVVSENLALAIADGQYQIGGIEGDVQVTGGQFWEQFYPTHVSPNAAVREISGDYKYEVVGHVHEYVYTANANVISVVCASAEACTLGTQTLTLTTAVARVSGTAYAGAGVVCSEWFPLRAEDVAIEYWKDGDKLATAPAAIGDYVAKVTVDGVTAESAFSILHRHTYAYSVDGDSIVATCQEAGTCDAKTFRATLSVPATSVYTASTFAGATASVDAGFPGEVKLTYYSSLSSLVPIAAELVGLPGNYSVKMSAGDKSVTKAFTISPADLARDVTVELEATSYGYDGGKHENGIKTVKIGNYTLLKGIDYTVAGDSFTQAGSPASNLTYSVTLTGKGCFAGSVTKSWTIETLGDKWTFSAGPQSTTEVNGTWQLSMSVEVPRSGLNDFTPTTFLRFESPHQSGYFTGDDTVSQTTCGIVLETGDISVMALSKYPKYAKSFTWTEAVTAAEVEAAAAAGQEKIVRTLKVHALAYEENLLYGNRGGIREVEFRMELPVRISDAARKERLVQAAGEEARGKVESIAGKEGENIDGVEQWMSAKSVTPEKLAGSDYVKSSYDLGVNLLDADGKEHLADVAFRDVTVDAENGLAFRIGVDFAGAEPEVVKAAKEKVAGYIWASAAIRDAFAPVDAERLAVDRATGLMTLAPDQQKTAEFLKIVLPEDR